MLGSPLVHYFFMRGDIPIVIIYFVSIALLSIQYIQLILEDPLLKAKVVILLHNDATKNGYTSDQFSGYNSEQQPDVSFHPSIYPEHSSSNPSNGLSTSTPTQPSVLPSTSVVITSSTTSPISISSSNTTTVSHSKSSPSLSLQQSRFITNTTNSTASIIPDLSLTSNTSPSLNTPPSSQQASNSTNSTNSTNSMSSSIYHSSLTSNLPSSTIASPSSTHSTKTSNISNSTSSFSSTPDITPDSIYRYQPIRLIPVSEVPYRTISDWGFPTVDKSKKSIRLLKKSESIPIKYNIDASFTHSRYFIIPNVKGLCNRLQLFAGLYILSSYFHIPIILSSSMEWSRYWNLRESFPGQLIELPDRGMFCSVLNN